MDPDPLKNLYRRWLEEVWGAGDCAVAGEVLAPDIVDHNALEGQPEGLDGQIWATRMVRRAFPDLRFREDVVVSDGEYVTGRWTMTGTHTGTFDLLGLPPTGRPVTMTGHEIFRGRDGRLVEVWHQEDLPGLLTQLGLTPPLSLLRLAARRSARRYQRERRRAG
jgi:predicted ester cyclase